MARGLWCSPRGVAPEKGRQDTAYPTPVGHPAREGGEDWRNASRVSPASEDSLVFITRYFTSEEGEHKKQRNVMLLLSR